MDSSGYIAITTFVVPIIVGIAMAIHPEWKIVGWAAICICSAVFFWAFANFLLTRTGPDSKTLLRTSALAVAVAGLTATVAIALLIELPRAASDANGAFLRMQFYGDTRVPTEIRQSNVANWFAYYSPIAQVREDSPAGPGRVVLATPKTWAIFIAFDRPTEVRQIVVNFNAPGLPQYQVLQSTKRAALISFAQDIPAGELEIEVRP